MSQSDASPFTEDAPTWEEMKQNEEEKSRENESKAASDRAGYFADQASKEWKDKWKRDNALQTTEMPTEDKADKDEKGPGTAIDTLKEDMDVPKRTRQEKVEGNETPMLPSGEKDYIDADYRIVDDGPPEEEKGYKVDPERLQGWGRTLRDIGVAGLDVGSGLLQAAEKQYGAVVKLTGQLMQGKPMSLPSQALAATMTGFGTINEAAEDAAKKLGVKPGVDPAKLRDQLAVKGPAYYRDYDQAKANTQFITKEFNDAIEEAATGKDITQLTDRELKQVFDRMESTLKPEYDAILQKPQGEWTQADRAFYNAYVSVTQNMGSRAKNIRQEQRSRRSAARQRERALKDELDQNKSTWYRSGQMTDAKDVAGYKRDLERKFDIGVPLTPEEEEDYDDIILNYGWRNSVRGLGSDMLRVPHRIPLWTQKAGTKLSRNFGGDQNVQRMYELARRGDIGALRAMIDTPEKRAAAMGFARMGLANQENEALRTKFPMSADDIGLAYAIDAAISDKNYAPPVKMGAKWAVPKWMRDKIAVEQAEKAKEQAKKQAKPAGTPIGTAAKPVETGKRPTAAAPTAEKPLKKPVKGGKWDYSGGLQHKAGDFVGEFDEGDRKLKAQSRNLTSVLNNMDRNDPNYTRITNLKNQADAEWLLHTVNGKNMSPMVRIFAEKILNDYREGKGGIQLTDFGPTPLKQIRHIIDRATPKRPVEPKEEPAGTSDTLETAKTPEEARKRLLQASNVFRNDEDLFDLSASDVEVKGQKGFDSRQNSIATKIFDINKLRGELEPFKDDPETRKKLEELDRVKALLENAARTMKLIDQVDEDEPDDLKGREDPGKKKLLDELEEAIGRPLGPDEKDMTIRDLFDYTDGLQMQYAGFRDELNRLMAKQGKSIPEEEAKWMYNYLKNGAIDPRPVDGPDPKNGRGDERTMDDYRSETAAVDEVVRRREMIREQAKALREAASKEEADIAEFGRLYKEAQSFGDTDTARQVFKEMMNVHLHNLSAYMRELKEKGIGKEDVDRALSRYIGIYEKMQEIERKLSKMQPVEEEPEKEQRMEKPKRPSRRKSAFKASDKDIEDHADAFFSTRGKQDFIRRLFNEGLSEKEASQLYEAFMSDERLTDIQGRKMYGSPEEYRLAISRR